MCLGRGGRRCGAGEGEGPAPWRLAAPCLVRPSGLASGGGSLVKSESHSVARPGRGMPLGSPGSWVAGWAHRGF